MIGEQEEGEPSRVELAILHRVLAGNIFLFVVVVISNPRRPVVTDTRGCSSSARSAPNTLSRFYTYIGFDEFQYMSGSFAQFPLG